LIDLLLTERESGFAGCKLILPAAQAGTLPFQVLRALLELLTATLQLDLQLAQGSFAGIQCRLARFQIRHLRAQMRLKLVQPGRSLGEP